MRQEYQIVQFCNDLARSHWQSIEFHDFFVSNTFFSTFIFEFHFENFYDRAASSPRLLKDELMIKKMFYSKDKNSRRVTKILEVVIFTRWYR